MGEIQGDQHDELAWRPKEEEEEEERARVDIYKYIFGFVEIAVVKCAIELGIADAIESHGGPMSLLDLSSALSCAPPTLHRIMRFLVNRRIFKENRNDIVQGCLYAQTALSRLLLKSGQRSMASFVLLESSHPMLAPWHGLSALVKAQATDSLTPFEAANGKDVWSYAAANPGHSQLINEAMACNARVTVAAILDDCAEVFDGIGTIVDVGGGNGTTMQLLVKGCPWIHQGINFDLPHVVSAALKSDGVVHVGGDMFDSVPKADAAFLMWVLHDWGDEECIQILNKCREAISDKGKLIIVESVIENKDQPDHVVKEKMKLKDVGLFLDMVMMVHTEKGKERTLEEWAYVLAQAGFTRYNVRSINGAVSSVIEAFPA
ncbi:acetylserotonin O-methyltransferase-like [Humulus lupulus]|uniref:acetylserotonin O-methyltransferase-like n=1 Tax=Humulus lupulus TaxID=3486 RepID=UPI002B400E21|nr:acetylserotonin O-methyltransferase-like [Humulus lupulus]